MINVLVFSGPYNLSQTAIRCGRRSKHDPIQTTREELWMTHIDGNVPHAFGRQRHDTVSHSTRLSSVHSSYADGISTNTICRFGYRAGSGGGLQGYIPACIGSSRERNTRGQKQRYHEFGSAIVEYEEWTWRFSIQGFISFKFVDGP